MKIPLQELIVTQGWLVNYHQFPAIDPPQQDTEEDLSWRFKEDMFQAKHQRFDRLIDLGWYPESDFVNGEYRLVLLAGDFRGKLLRELRTKSREDVVETMNEWFYAVTAGQF